MKTPDTTKAVSSAAVQGASIVPCNVLQLTLVKAEPRADTRLLAIHMGKKHRSIFALVQANKSDFDEFGKVRFEIAPSPSGQPEKFAMLNEDQAYLLLTYARNNPKVRALKVKMVAAFRDARRAAEIRQDEYLPSYHAMHNAIKLRANGSENERFMHINANKALNQLVGVLPGQRARAGLMQQSLMAVGCAVAAKAVIEAPDRQGLHQHIKNALLPLTGLLLIEGKQ